jgi:hypothetical protein
MASAPRDASRLAIALLRRLAVAQVGLPCAGEHFLVDDQRAAREA